MCVCVCVCVCVCACARACVLARAAKSEPRVTPPSLMMPEKQTRTKRLQQLSWNFLIYDAYLRSNKINISINVQQKMKLFSITTISSFRIRVVKIIKGRKSFKVFKKSIFFHTSKVEYIKSKLERGKIEILNIYRVIAHSRECQDPHIVK